jgi:hypothetical protein
MAGRFAVHAEQFTELFTEQSRRRGNERLPTTFHHFRGGTMFAI